MRETIKEEILTLAEQFPGFHPHLAIVQVSRMLPAARIGRERWTAQPDRNGKKKSRNPRRVTRVKTIETRVGANTWANQREPDADSCTCRREVEWSERQKDSVRDKDVRHKDKNGGDQDRDATTGCVQGTMA